MTDLSFSFGGHGTATATGRGDTTAGTSTAGMEIIRRRLLPRKQRRAMGSKRGAQKVAAANGLHPTKGRKMHVGRPV